MLNSKKVLIFFAAVVVLVIIGLLLWRNISYGTSVCNSQPDWNNKGVDGSATPCPEGCALSSCYGYKTWCCPT